MTTWLIWFEDHKETVGLYQHNDQLEFMGDFPLIEVRDKIGAASLLGVFPTEHVSFVDTPLPKTSEKKLRLALPSLVEEAIASHPEDNFYALPHGFQSGEICMVGVTSVAYLHNIIHQCGQAGLNLNQLFPDCFLLPKPNNNLHKMIHGERVIVRNGDKQGFALQKQHAVLIMQELDDLTSQEPGTLEVSPFNFLQAQFACKPPKQSWGKMKKISIALGGVIAVHFITLIILGSILNHRLEAFQAENLALYSEIFPGAVKMTSPKALIERELKTYSGHADVSFSGALASLSRALAETPTAELLVLEYHQNRLSAQIKLPNMEALDQLTQALSSIGAQAEQEQITEENNSVSVQLRIAS